MNRCVSVTEAARIKGVTRQAVYLAMRLGKLKAYRHGERWKVFMVDLDAYDAGRYSRSGAVHKGEKVFDESRGYVSMERASQMIGIDRQKLYYAARTGKIKAMRKGTFWVLRVTDLMKYQDKLQKESFTKRRAG